MARILIVAAAALAFAVVALHGIAGYRGTEVIVAQFAEARQDADTIVAIDRVLDDVVNAETGQRGFLLTGDRQYLEPYRRGVHQLQIDLRNVRRLTAAEPEQQQPLGVVRAAPAARRDELAQTIQVYERDGPAAAKANVASDRGRRLMAAVRRTIREMRDHEERERGAARADADARSERR